MADSWKNKSENTKGHIIYKSLRTGKRVPGGSTIAGVYAPFGSSDGLIDWAIREHIAGNDHRKVRDESARFGTCIHRHFECSIKGVPFPYSDHAPAYTEIAERSTNNLRTWMQNNGLRARHSELAVVSEKYQFGGTIDLTLEPLEQEPGATGVLVLSDLKSSTYLNANHLIQVLGGYRLALEGLATGDSTLVVNGEPQYPANPREWAFDIQKFVLLRVDREDGSVHPHWFPKGVALQAGEAFLDCKSIYEHGKELNKAARRAA